MCNQGQTGFRVDMEALVAEPAPARITGQIVGPGCSTFSMKPHDG